MRLRKVEKRLTEEGRKRQLWKRKGSVKIFVLYVCSRERTYRVKRKTGRYVMPEFGDSPAN